jgi:hypothetical protein
LTRKGESEDSIEVIILVLDPVTDTVLKEYNSAFMPQLYIENTFRRNLVSCHCHLILNVIIKFLVVCGS